MSRVFPTDSDAVCILIIGLCCSLGQESVECLIVNSILCFKNCNLMECNYTLYRYENSCVATHSHGICCLFRTWLYCLKAVAMTSFRKTRVEFTSMGGCKR